MKENCFWLILCIALLSCGQPNFTEIESQSNGTSVVVDSSIFAILPLEAAETWNFDNGIPTTLNSNDLIEIENVLKRCVEDYNASFSLNHGDSLDSSNLIDFMIMDLNEYKRQYFPMVNERGEKVVWVNCFCSGVGTDWRVNIVSVFDGGNCFFNLKINLSTNEYYDFMVNGVA